MSAYYNEIDPFAAAWLRELINANLIAPGEVDERSIEEVESADLKEFTQCHFFAGIGVWSYALRAAGWPDDIAVWTGSCPCQGFSSSGKRKGFSDKRHLWPAWFRLIRQCRPQSIFGEQVASEPGRAWFDVVSAALEREKYAIGAADLSAAGVGAPHIRQRLFFVADSRGQGLEIRSRHTGRTSKEKRWWDDSDRSIRVGGVGHPTEHRLQKQPVARAVYFPDEAEPKYVVPSSGSFGTSEAEQLGNTDRTGCSSEPEHDGTAARRKDFPRGSSRLHTLFGSRILSGPWSNAEWIYCRDGKYRAVEPGTFPLAHGAPARVGRLRGYGNAINAEVAKAFIEAYIEVMRENAA